jgi:hypothetical protein
VSTALDTVTDPQQGQVGTGNPQIEHVQLEAGSFHTAQQSNICAAGQRGFKRKVGSGFGEFGDALQNRAPGAQHSRIGIEGGQTAGNQVGIDEIAAVGVERKEFRREPNVVFPAPFGPAMM